MNEVTVPLDSANLILAVVLPILTAVVTARFANSAVKTVVLIALTVIATTLQEIFDSGRDFALEDFAMTTTLQFVMSVALHFGLLKPVNVTGDNGKVATAVPAGVGAPKPPPVGPVQD